MSYQLCLAYPKTTIPNNGFRDLPELPPSLKTLNEAPDDSRGTEVRLPPPPASERITDFATNDSTSVVYSAAPGFHLEPGASVTFSADGLPKGVSIDKDTGHIRGVVDHSASHGFEGTAIYDVRVIATDNNTGAETFRYFKWTVSNTEPEAMFDFGETGENGQVIGNVLSGFGKGADEAIEDGMYMVRPSAFGAGRDIDLDGDPLEVSMVAGHPRNVGEAVVCPGGGILTMHKDGDYSFRAPPDSEDQPAAGRPLLLAPYVVRDSEGEVDTAFLFLDQSNGALGEVAAETAAHAIASVAEVEAGVRQSARARITRAAEHEPDTLRDLLEGPGERDLSPLLEHALGAHPGAGRADATQANAGAQGIDSAQRDVVMPTVPSPAAEGDAGLSAAHAEVAAQLMAELLRAMGPASLA